MSALTEESLCFTRLPYNPWHTIYHHVKSNKEPSLANNISADNARRILGDR